MKSRNVQYVGFLLVIMTMFYVLSKVEESSNVPPTDNLFTIEQTQVGRIRVSRHNETTDMIRQDTVWVMVGFEDTPLPIDRLNGFFYGILDVKRETMISENPAQWARYGVDDSTGMQLELFDLAGVSAGHYVVGASKSNSKSSYIRAYGTNEVYLTTIPIHNGLRQLVTLFERSR